MQNVVKELLRAQEEDFTYQNRVVLPGGSGQEVVLDFWPLVVPGERDEEIRVSTL